MSFFVGFSTDKKYEDILLFGILKSESNEKIEKLNLDEDINGNKIQEKISINEKFLSLDESEQKSKISKWLNEQIRTIFALYTMWNGRPKAEYLRIQTSFCGFRLPVRDLRFPKSP